MHQSILPLHRPLPTSLLDAVVERLIVRAIAYSTGKSEPRSTAIPCDRSDQWSKLVDAYVGEVPYAKHQLGGLFALCEARDAELAAFIVRSYPVRSVHEIGDVSMRHEAKLSLVRLAFHAQRSPDLDVVLNLVIAANLEELAKYLSFVLQVPPKHLQRALVRIDRGRATGAPSRHESAVARSWTVQLLRTILS